MMKRKRGFFGNLKRDFWVNVYSPKIESCFSKAVFISYVYILMFIFIL